MNTGVVEFRHVSFSYPNNQSVFADFDLHIRAGERIGLVGHSGAGKSTITKLLLRFTDVTEGAITIDGQDIRKVTQDDLRSVVSYVPQEPVLFHRSLRENIAYGKTGATESMIIDAAQKANAWDFISQFPDGLETLVGERGTQLSGGQRQRIAIARAVLKNPRILILDEATSSLDSESERLVQDALEHLMKGRTSIVIAHRLSTIRQADNILVMDNGRIIEQGTHEQLLLVKDGLYRSLSELQFAG